MTKTKPQNPTCSEEKRCAVYFNLGPTTELVGAYKTLEEAAKAGRDFGYRMHDEMVRAERRYMLFGEEELLHGKS